MALKSTYITAEEYCDSVRDGTHDTPEPIESGYKLITGKHIKNGQIDASEAYNISEDDYDAINIRSRVEQWDVLLSMIGTVGESVLVRDIPNYAIKNLALFKCGGNSLKGKWLYYYLQSPYAKSMMISTMNGSSQQFLSLRKLRDFPILITDKKRMSKVVDILSAYDDLIANNQKQIKLLEEAAQRLYKEWFVKLHFPGYENVPVVDGVPEGWKKEDFSKIINIMSGGTPKTDNPNYYGGNIPFYTPKDSGEHFFAFQTEKYITEEGLENCNSRLYPVNTVIITARGTVGNLALLAVPMAMNQSCFALKSDKLDAPYYLFFAVHKEIEAFKKMANGGVFDTIVLRTFDNIKMTIPNKNIVKNFEETVKPIMEQIKIKIKLNLTLSEARNRLLPKLMSGEIEV